MYRLRVLLNVTLGIICVSHLLTASPIEAIEDNDATKDVVADEFTVEVAYEETARSLASFPTSPKIGTKRNVARDSAPGYDGCPSQQDRPECVELAHSLGALTGLFNPSYENVLMPVPSLQKLVQMCDTWDTVMHIANIDPEQCCHLDHHCYQMRRNMKTRKNLR